MNGKKTVTTVAVLMAIFAASLTPEVKAALPENFYTYLSAFSIVAMAVLRVLTNGPIKLKGGK